jgi:hypothetical protein
MKVLTKIRTGWFILFFFQACWRRKGSFDHRQNNLAFKRLDDQNFRLVFEREREPDVVT